MENLTSSAAVEVRKNARESIEQHIRGLEDDNVLRSVVLILGDYAVSKDGEDRAKFIVSIIYNLVINCDMRNLALVYAFVNEICKGEDI